MRRLTSSLLLAGLLSAPGWAAHVHQVRIEAMRFQPARVVAAPGDTIVWTNRDLVAHTVTAEDHSFDSHNLAPGATFRFRVPKAEVVSYHCLFHPTMKGSLTAR